MAKHTLNRLTARQVATAKPGKHPDGGRLWLIVSKNGTGKWVFRFTVGRKRTYLGLGSARNVSLADARKAAAACRERLEKGEYPRVGRQKEAVPTFGEAADAYVKAHRSSWRNAKHAAQWEMTLREHAAPLRSMPVSDIATEHVLAALLPIWSAIPVTASRLRGRIEVVLDAAKAKGHRQGENCARWRGHLDKLLPKAKRLARGHHKAMPFDEVPAFIADLRARQATAARALEFVILTAARSGELLGAHWREIDLKAKVWTVPSERMKSGRQHRVPLSSRALELLEEMTPLTGSTDDYVFPGPRKSRPLSGVAMPGLLRRMNVAVTTHGFRSAFRDWAGDRSHFPRDVAEAALAHVVGNEVERAYRRSDALEKRRKLMEAWAEFLNEPHRGNVVSITRAG